jgi:SprT-like family
MGEGDATGVAVKVECLCEERGSTPTRTDQTTDLLHLNVMDEKTLILLADALLSRCGLVGWSVRINRRLRDTEGRCVTATRTIELHQRCWEFDDPEQTILHEIAHAIHWERIRNISPMELRPREEFGHGRMWQAICAEVGYRVPDYYLEAK